jgi:DNA-binding NtrC family response regulator
VVNVYVVEQDSPASRLVRWCLQEDGVEFKVIDDPRRLTELLRQEDDGVVIFNVQAPIEEKAAQIHALKEDADHAKVVDIEAPTSDAVPEADVTLRMPFHADDLSIAIRMLAL